MALNAGVADVRENYRQVLVALGAARSANGDFPGAAKAYQRAVDHEPGRWDVWNNLANALRNAGRADEAVDAYHRAAKLAPASGIVLSQPGQHAE